MVIERVGGSSIGDPTIQRIDEIVSAVAGKSPEEYLEALEHCGIQSYISAEGTLFIRSWQVFAERFVSPERAVEIRMRQREPEHVANLDWLSSNLEELRRLYAGHWIAIAHGEVIASAPTLPELVEAAEATGVVSPFVTFMAEQETTWDMAYGWQNL